MTLTIGDKAPNFNLESSEGERICSDDFFGKKVALYFYPKDDTPGCTIEACELRDLNNELTLAGVVVLGISADSIDSHNKFSKKFNLNFPLLSDANKDVANAYGAWGEKMVRGSKVIGMRRMTFLINETGHIQQIWHDVTPKGHAQEILKASAE